MKLDNFKCQPPRGGWHALFALALGRVELAGAPGRVGEQVVVVLRAGALERQPVAEKDLVRVVVELLVVVAVLGGGARRRLGALARRLVLAGDVVRELEPLGRGHRDAQR